MKKTLAALSVAIIASLAVLALASCDTPADTGAEGIAKSVGVVLPNDDATRWVQDKTRFEEGFAAEGIPCQVLFSDNNVATEAQNVATLLESGIGVLIISPYSSSEAAPAVEAARSAGVKVIAYDRLLTNTVAVDYYVTFDSLTVGEMQGQYLVDHVTDSGNPLYLYAGSQLDNNSFLFFQGAWSVLQPKIADGTFVIANSPEAAALEATLALSRTQTEGILGTNPVVIDEADGTRSIPEIDGITTHWNNTDAALLAAANLAANEASLKGDVFVLAPNDGTARGIISALKNDAAVTSYVITGQDAEMASIQSIIDGEQTMTVFKDVRTLLADTITVVRALVNGETPAFTATYDNGSIEVKTVQTEVVCVDADNVQEAIIDTGYYEESDFDW